MLTPLVLLVGFLLYVGIVAVWVATLRLCARLFTEARLTKERGVVLVAFKLAVTLVVAVAVLSTPSPIPTWCLDAFVLPAAFVAEVVVVRRGFGIRWWQAFVAELGTAVTGLIVVAFLFFGVRPFFAEAYAVAANNMAPTFIGRHVPGTCPSCGEATFRSPRVSASHDIPELSICRRYHVTAEEDPEPSRPFRESRSSKSPAEETREGDRIVVVRTVAPRRWDVVAGHWAGNAKNLSLFRIVGLPGETITIVEGAVHVDDRPLEIPEGVPRISYTVEEPRFLPFVPAGEAERPAVLGDDEYFVLGDFTRRSNDSRYWQEAHPGHPSYALPRSAIVGVVTTIYWPPSRWRAFR